MAQVALVTGGVSGIGFGIAKALASAGTHIVVADIQQDRALQTATELPKKAASLMKSSYKNLKISDPDVIVDMILKAITSKNPKTHYVVSYMSKTYLFFRRILPDKIFDRLLCSSLK